MLYIYCRGTRSVTVRMCYHDGVMSGVLCIKDGWALKMLEGLQVLALHTVSIRN